MACIVLIYHKQSDLYHKHTQLLQLLCKVTLHYPHQGSFSEVELEGLIFVYFVSILQPILGLTYAMLMVEQPGIDTSTLSSLDVWGMAGFKKFLCRDWFILYSPLSWYSQVSRFGGTATVISRLNFLLSGYFIQFPDYHHHAAATTTFSGAHTWRSWTDESILSLLELAKSATVSADFLVFFPEFFRSSHVTVGTNVGRTVKSSPNAMLNQ